MHVSKKVWVGLPPTHRSFQPYVIAIGQAAIAWNGLHEALNGLFWTLTNMERPASAAVWNAIRSDRTQRDMILAVAKMANEMGDLADIIYDRVGWLLKQIDALSNARNYAIHAPLVSSLRGGVQPDSRGGNRMASKLRDKNLLAEFRRCRDRAIELTAFCLSLDHCLYAPGQSGLPDIPGDSWATDAKRGPRRSARGKS